ncbi:hypothetical protein MFIFM68171_09307 [Madurella fahalii]|uniref:Uncharacterized protein n=1 Tax=Madurella fahalii TaxID=1157608 RepID=A0ABQ0GMV8_9PEZI
MVFTASPPARQPTASEDAAFLEHHTLQSADQPDAYPTNSSQSDRSLEIACSFSSPSSSGDAVSLRGGVSESRSRGDSRYRPPSARDEEDESEGESEEGYIDYRYVKAVPEDDSLSTSSDWDNYGNLPMTMDEYNETVARLEGSEDWNAEQRKLHKLIYMRGLHPMMPSWWRLSFKMWGVTQQELDDVFTPKHSRKRVAIHAHGNELGATKALESLFYLSQTVADYEEIGYQHKIARTIGRGLRNYINWSLRDAGIYKAETQLNILVKEYPPDFTGYDDNESTGSTFTASLAGSDRDLDAEMTGTVDIITKTVAVLTEEEQQRRFTRAISRDLERRLRDLGGQWRELLRNESGRGYMAQPPTLYAFAIVQHIVMLASHDPSVPDNPVVVLEQVRMNDRGQWLWNALSLAIPVNMARDGLDRLWDTGLIAPLRERSDSDPDL